MEGDGGTRGTPHGACDCYGGAPLSVGRRAGGNDVWKGAATAGVSRGSGLDRSRVGAGDAGRRGGAGRFVCGRGGDDYAAGETRAGGDQAYGEMAHDAAAFEQRSF